MTYRDGQPPRRLPDRPYRPERTSRLDRPERSGRSDQFGHPPRDYDNAPRRNTSHGADRAELPKEIYQRRRIAALVALLVIIGLLVWALTALGGGGDKDPQGAAVTSSAAPTSAASSANESEKASESESVASSEDADGESESASASASESETEPTESESESAEPAAAGKDSCDLGDLKITATSDKANYAPGEQPKFYMSVDNPTKKDCQVNLDKDKLRFEVYDLATNQPVWSDTDCNPAVERGEQTFEAGDKRNFEAVWSRLSSGPDQCGDRAPAPAGAYFLHAVVGDNPSAAYTFNLG